jgi:hypothetical protein
MPLTTFLLNTKRTIALGAVAAGATVQTTSIIDMQGFESILFEVLLGTLTTGQTLGVLQVQAGNAANGSDMANLVGATITTADASASKGVSLEVYKPSNFRYIQLVFTRNTQAAQILSIIAEQAGDHKRPESEDATTFPQALIAVEPQYTNAQLSTQTYTVSQTTTTVVNTYRSAS